MEVWHMNGAGNDFLVMDVRGKTVDLSAAAKKYCPQYGADGLMALDNSEKADLRLHFYNADGSRGEMCGNGSRCVCRFAYEKGIVGAEMTVEADAGIVRGWRINQTEYRIALNVPSVLDLQRKPGVAYVELGAPGLPHAVVAQQALQWQQRESLRQRAKGLRFDPAFPKGTNVNFYTRLDDERVRILSYERGVEDYTLACGTGSAAVAAVLWARGELRGGTLIVENPGGNLTVSVEGAGATVTGLRLQGPTQTTQVLELSL